MRFPDVPPIPSISDITDEAWRLAGPTVRVGERAVDAGRRMVEPVLGFGESTAERVLGAGERMLSPIVDAGREIGGRAVERGSELVRGIGSETVELAEQIVGRLMQVTNQSIDAMVNRVRETTSGVIAFVDDIAHNAASRAGSVVDRAFGMAEDLARDISRIPEEALELVGSGEEILQRTRERSASIRRYIDRFRDRRRALPRIVGEHVEEFALEIEEELEADAAEAEMLGERALRDSRLLYERTVSDAQRYGTVLLRQTEENVRRGDNLRRSIVDGATAVRDWAITRMATVTHLGADRIRAGMAIRSLGDAQRWSTDSIAGIHQIASEIEHEARTRPGEVASFAENRVADAVALATGIETEVVTAQEWLNRQRGNNATWRTSMRTSRNMAEEFLRAQASRVEMRVIRHGELIASTARDMGVDLVHDTINEVTGLGRDGRDLAIGIGREMVAGATAMSAELRVAPFAETPPPAKTNVTVEIPIPEHEEAEDVPVAGGEAGASAGLEPPEAVHVSRPSNNDKGSRSNTPANRRASETGATPENSGDKQGRSNANHSNTQSPNSNSGSAKPVTTPNAELASPKPEAGKPQTPAPEKKLVEPEKKQTAVQTSVNKPTPTNSPTPTAIDLNNNIAQPHAQAKPKEKPQEKAKEKSSGPVDSKVMPGATLPKVEKKGKSTKKEADSVDAAPTPTTAKPTDEGKAKAKPGPSQNVAQPVKSKPQSEPGQQKPPKPGEAIKPNDKGDEPKTPAFQAPKPIGRNYAGAQAKKAQNAAPEDPKEFRNRLVQAGGSGNSPDAGLRADLTPHLGYDPSIAKLHIGPTAHAAAKSLGADAFTVGKDIFFAEGKFDPKSPKGMGLIAHELTHVVQQTGRRDNRMQFATKTGGDNMEQEAQEVGERVASNLAYGMGMRVGRYIRTYEPADDEPVSSRVQTKLDGLSLRALSKAGQMLSSRPNLQALQLDEVLVDLQINLEESSDLEIIEQWAEAIVSAVEAARPAASNTQRANEALEPATHILQKKLGDPGEEQAAEPPKKVDPEVMARILKITPSATDKDMIRKLLVREHIDDMVKSSRAKQMSAEYDDAWIAVAVGMPVFTSGGIHPDDRAAIEAKLKEYEIDSYEDFLKLKADFVTAFEKKGVDIVKYMLAENLNIVLQQKKRYLSRDKAEADAPINTIKTSAEQVKKAMDEYIATIYATFDRFHWFAIGAHSNQPNHGNLDSMTELYLTKIDKKSQETILSAYKRFSKVRQAHGDKHPILLGRDFNPDTVLNEKSAGDLELKLFHHFADVEKDIRYAQDGMSTDKFWELPQMVSMTRTQLGVREGEGAAKTIDETQKAKSEDAAFWAILQAAAAIALAVTAMVATGGLAAVAMVGSAGLSVYSAAKAVDDYMFKSAAVNSSLDQARLISKDEPSLFWLAVELIGAGLDVAGAVGAFGKLASIARRAMNTSEVKALKELEEAARDAYKGTKGLAMSEDDFVARLLESAKKGVSSTEGMVKQAKLATELLEGTSARAVAIMKNDPKAIQSLVSEYGNWKGLMGSLTNGGEDAAKMSQNIGAWRQKIINELPEGARPLENASTEIVSDFDINVKPHNGTGAGERVLQLEKEMASKYGANWSEALLMNFYTDKSQLLTVEKALKSVSPQKQAEILARVTKKSEQLNFAKMLEHAGNDPAAIKQVEELMKTAGVKYGIEDLKALGDTVKNKGRDALLLDIDAKIKELDALPPNSPQRVSKAEQITELQMEANFLTKEAYISPAAVKGGPLTNAEAFQSALSQLEMIRHVIHESGGDILKACREYELFKYINRYAGAAKKAGANSPGLTYFENLSAYIYKRARSAHMETGHLPGVTPADEALEAAVDGQWLLDQYNMFKKEVDQSLPKMRDAAEKNPAGGWKADDAPKMGGPAAGKPAGPSAPTPAPAGPTGQVFTPKPSDLKSGATLPAAAIATKKAVDKAMDKSGKKPTATVGPENAVKSAGFSSTKAKEGIGMFIGTIPGLKTEVFITVMSADDRSKFEQQFGAALAAEKTGFGPKVHGKIDMGKDKLAFATDVVKGGYADAYKSTGNTPDDQVSPNAGSKGEMMKNAQAIKPETFQDIEGYSKSLFESGFYYVGPVDGFVTPEGRWKPVNFYNATAMTADTVQDEAWKSHAAQFEILKDNLMKRHLEAKGVAGKKAK